MGGYGLGKDMGGSIRAWVGEGHGRQVEGMGMGKDMF